MLSCDRIHTVIKNILEGTTIMEAARIIPFETTVRLMHLPSRYLIECQHRWQIEEVDKVAMNYRGKRIGEFKRNPALRDFAIYEFESEQDYCDFEKEVAKLVFRTTEL